MSFGHVVRSIVIVSVFVMGSKAMPQQQPLLQGIVVEAGSETPIARATVELRPVAGGESVAAVTRSDSSGKFYLPRVAPGMYRLVASHAGHIVAEFGQRQQSAPGTPINPANPPANIRIAMTAGGVISGRIFDKGRPIGNSDAVLVKAIYTE